MHKYALSFVFLVSTLLFADTAVAQMDDEPPPPPPLGDVDEPPPPPRRAHSTRRNKSNRDKKATTTDDDSPVVRANGEEGNMGLFFRFGGMATMTATGDSEDGKNGGNTAAMNAQIGLKFVMSESIMVPLFFGMSLRSTSVAVKNADDPDTTYNFSMDLGVGVEYHFRIWRRLSPFCGALLKLGFYEPTGEDNLGIRFRVGPTIGVEYYIADRVSLAVAYMLLLSVAASPVGADSTTTNFDMTTKDGYEASAESGGDLTLTFYF